MIWNGRYLLDDNYGTTGGTSSDTVMKTMMTMMIMVVAVNAFQRSLSVIKTEPEAPAVVVDVL